MLNQVIKKIIRRLIPQKLFIKGLTGSFYRLELRALLYYKTSSLCDRDLALAYTHTNEWEIIEIIRILNSLGFVVDVVDRALDDFDPEDKYDLFVGLGAGSSGKYFAKYGSRLTKAVKVLLAAGPKPDISDRLVRERYDSFNNRNGVNAPYMRIIDKINFAEFLKYTDCILAIGEDGLFCNESYRDCGKPVKYYLPSSSPRLGFRLEWLKTRKRNKFLCFAGNGLICKGADILIEAFREMPDMELVICGPKEDALFEVYGQELSGQGNIKYEGFVGVSSERFNTLCGECAFVILNTASEGCATSVTTCMRCGLVPVINYENSIEVGNFGFLIDNSDGLVAGTMDVVRKAASITAENYSDRVFNTLKDSAKYTQGSFSTTFENAILEIMQEKFKG